MRLTLRGLRRFLLQLVSPDMMTFNDAVELQAAMLRAGQVLEALDMFFADYGVMYTNGAVFGEGLQACREKQEPFVASAQNIKGEITDLFVDAENEFCIFRNTTSYDDESGTTHRIDGLHVQMWAQGKIATEWFYSGEPMRGMIARGLLKDPAHILELIS